jgi:hypothetical protein
MSLHASHVSEQWRSLILETYTIATGLRLGRGYVFMLTAAYDSLGPEEKQATTREGRF